MSNHAERRKHPRAYIKESIKLLDEDKQEIHGLTCDICEAGLKIFCTTPIPSKNYYEFTFNLPNNYHISGYGQIVYSSKADDMEQKGYYLGIQFFMINFTHLQQIRSFVQARLAS